MTHAPAADLPARAIGSALWRGARGRCPNCGEGRMFNAYLKVVDHCEVCDEALYHHRADDAPAYVVITIVAHIVVSALIGFEVAFHPALWIHFVLWIPLTIGMSLFLLPVCKGALVGAQWAMRMHGFMPGSPESLEGPGTGKA